MKRLSLVLLIAFALSACSSPEAELPPPNILWIVSEDNSPFLGCYGDTLAVTPNLDQLATEGMRFDRAFANAPVCAPARFTLITGTYASSMGTENMRSVYSIPEEVRFYPHFLRAKGYYCTNRRKKDYNTPDQPEAWDESGNEAHYSKRPEGAPFFHIVNFTTSHESSIHKLADTLMHDPAEMNLPPYHPDLPEIRRDWAQYYDKVSVMDKEAGAVIAQLKADGLYDNTLIFYYSDHGGILPRSKRFLYTSGQRVPLIIRVPKQYQKLFPGYEAGGHTDRIISFVDFAPTLLSLLGIEAPAYMQGHAFLGKYAQPERDFAYGYASRMDAKLDLSRSISAQRYRYIRNFMPEKPWGQYLQYLWRAATAQAWQDACERGDCDAYQQAFWQPKGPEELYDVIADPHNLHNLANDPKHQATLKKMRGLLKNEMLAQRDMLVVPELARVDSLNAIRRAEIQAEDFDYEALWQSAWRASNGVPMPTDSLAMGLNHTGYQRYWALRACLQQDPASIEGLRPALEAIAYGESTDIYAITALGVLYRMGATDQLWPRVAEVLVHPQFTTRFYMLEIMKAFTMEDLARFRPRLQALSDMIVGNKRPYDARVAQRFMELLDKK